MHYAFTCSILTLLLCTAPARSEQEVALDTGHLTLKVDQVDPRLEKLGIPSPRAYAVQLDQVDSGFDFTGIYYSQALKLAAQFYAIQTGDFSPSLAEMYNAGWFPFDIAGSHLESKAIGPLEGSYPLISSWELDRLKSKEGVLFARKRILDEFYWEMLSHASPYSQLDPSVLRRTEAFWSDPQTSAQMTESSSPIRLEMLSVEQFNERTPNRPVVMTNRRAQGKLPYFRFITSSESTDYCCWLTSSFQNVAHGNTGCITWKTWCPLGGPTRECKICFVFEECDVTIWRYQLDIAPCDDPHPGFSIPCPTDFSICDRIAKGAQNCEVTVWTEPDPCPPPPPCAVAVEENFDKDEFIDDLEDLAQIYADFECHHCECP